MGFLSRLSGFFGGRRGEAVPVPPRRLMLRAGRSEGFDYNKSEQESTPAQRGSVVVATQRTDYVSQATSAAITPDTLVSALSNANRGQIRRLVEIVEDAIEKDSHLSSVVQTRKLAVSKADWELLSSAPDDAADDSKIVDFCTKALKGIPSLEDRFLDLLDGIVQPLGACEIIWAYRGPDLVPVDLVWIHPKRFGWNTTYEGLSGLDLGELRVLTDSNSTIGDRLLADKFIVHTTRSRSGWPCRSGLGRALIILYLYKIYNIKDWASHDEQFAQPIVYAELTDNPPDGERAMLETALSGGLGPEARAVVSKGTAIHLVSQTGTAASASYGSFVDFLDKQASKLVLGHTGAADATSGSLGGVDKAAGAVRQDILLADARALATTIRRDLLTPMVRWKFGADKPVPYLHFLLEEATDRKAEAERLKILVEAGFLLPAQWAREQQGIPDPEEGEEILELPAAAPAAGGFDPYGRPPA